MSSSKADEMRPAEVSAHFDPCVRCFPWSVYYLEMEMEKCCLPCICETVNQVVYCPTMDLFSWFRHGCVIELTILAKPWALLHLNTVILMELNVNAPNCCRAMASISELLRYL